MATARIKPPHMNAVYSVKRKSGGVKNVNRKKSRYEQKGKGDRMNEAKPKLLPPPEALAYFRACGALSKGHKGRKLDHDKAVEIGKLSAAKRKAKREQEQERGLEI